MSCLLYPVALACDITEMYLRIEMNPKDRLCHRFLWRQMNCEQESFEYEFNRLVHLLFGFNSCPSTMPNLINKITLGQLR